MIHDGAIAAMLEVLFNGVPKESMEGYTAGTGLVTLPRAGLTLQVIHKGAKAVNAECAVKGVPKEAQEAMLEVCSLGFPRRHGRL